MSHSSFPIPAHLATTAALAHGYVITAPVSSGDSPNDRWESYVYCPAVLPYTGEFYFGTGATPDEAIVRAVAVTNLRYEHHRGAGPCPCDSHRD